VNGETQGEIIESKVDLDVMYINQELDSPALWAGNWTQICPTCRIVKPLRCKHDQFSNRCVENFDHHCPWVANAIGKQNRWHFVVFLVLQMWALVVSIAIAGYKLSHLNKSASHATPFLVSFLVFDGSLGVSVLTLLLAQGNSIAKNLTTNEMANSHRYNYLGMDSYGRIFNPFDKGCHQNCLEVIHPSKGISPVRLEDEMYDKIRDWITDKHVHEAPPHCKPCCSKPNQKCGSHARENIV
jgi:palmitoyltransferase